MTRPVRVQLSRKKGWRMPPNTVKVDRTTIWGNPFPVTPQHPAKEAVRTYRRWLRMSQTKIMAGARNEDGTANPWAGLKMICHRQAVLKRLPELRGKNLACWCPLDQPCHADVLLELANK